MDFTFENQGTTTYLVYTVKDGDEVDSMSLGMIINNKIPGVAPAVVTQMNTRQYIKFNVSARASVKQFFSGPVNKKRLLGIFAGIADAMLSAEDYMIDPAMFILDLEHIFADVSTCDTVLICLPIVSKEKKTGDSLEMFFKKILFTTQFDQTENCDHVARIMNYLNSAPAFSLVEFRKLITALSQERAPAAGAVEQTRRPAAPAGAWERLPQAVNPVVPQQQPVAAQQPPVPQNFRQPDGHIPSATPPVPKPKKTAKHEKSMPVPPGPGIPAVSQGLGNSASSHSTSGSEKPISWFYLMQHYNKENAAAYKAQKEKKKAQKAAAAPATSGYSVPGAPQNGTPGAPGFPGAAPNAAPVTPVSTGAASNAGAFPPAPTGVAYNRIPYAPPPNRPVAPAAVSSPAMRPASPSEISAAPFGTSAGNPVPGNMANFGDTTVLNPGRGGDTTDLATLNMTSFSVASPFLIRRKNNERIRIDRAVFRIGKEKSNVDYFVSDNAAVSRSHANILTREGKYFIVDTDSTNHTFVNGVMIQSRSEVPLNSGDTVRFANEEFEFKVM